MPKRGPIGRTRRQMRKAHRGWSFSSSSSPRHSRIASRMSIHNHIPFRNETRRRSISSKSSKHSAWRSVSSANKMGSKK